MSAPEPWPAGKYELLATSWDEVTSKPNEPLDYVRHVTGDIVTLNAEHARRLGRTGSIVKPGEREQLALEVAKQALEAAERAAAEAQRKALAAPVQSAPPKAPAPAPKV